MGWANCGTDSKRRRIGYAVSAKCDHPGCKERIDRGLGYACGDMHGSDCSCEGYFCEEHVLHRYVPPHEAGHRLCLNCAAELDAQRLDAFLTALLQINDGAEPIETARAALLEWDELPSPTPETTP